MAAKGVEDWAAEGEAVDWVGEEGSEVGEEEGGSEEAGLAAAAGLAEDSGRRLPTL